MLLVLPNIKFAKIFLLLTKFHVEAPCCFFSVLNDERLPVGLTYSQSKIFDNEVFMPEVLCGHARGAMWSC